MKTDVKVLRSHCPINFCLEYLGDRWSLLIIRDIVFRAKKTYGEFLASEEGFSTNILANRLEQLCTSGILSRKYGATDKRNITYILTEKGRDLIPMLFEMLLWSAKYDPASEAQRIPGLVQEIEEDNRRVSQKMSKLVEDGKAVVKEYS